MLLRVNEQRNILREIRKRKANWIGYRRKDKKREMEVTRRQEEDVRNYWMTLRTGEDTLI